MQLDSYVEQLLPALALRESEDTWHKIDAALARLHTIAKGGGTRQGNFTAWIKHLAPMLVQSVRTTRSIDLLTLSCSQNGRSCPAQPQIF